MMRFLFRNLSPFIALLLVYRYTSITATPARVFSEILINGESESSLGVDDTPASNVLAPSDQQQDGNANPTRSFGHLGDDYSSPVPSEYVRLQRIGFALVWVCIVGLLSALLVVLMHLRDLAQWINLSGGRRERVSNTEDAAVENLREQVSVRRNQRTQQPWNQDLDGAMGSASVELATNPTTTALDHPPFYYLKFRSTELIARAMYFWMRSIVIAFLSFRKVRAAQELTCA